MSARVRAALVLALVASSVGCDQATKRIAAETLAGRPAQSFLGDLFRLQYAENKGAFLSLGGRLPEELRFLIFTVGVGILLVGIVAYAMLSRKLGPAHVVAFALVAGGGISNWLDRATRGGAVIDFMNLGIGGLRTGVFNVADLAIVGGVAVLVLVKQRPVAAQ